MGHFMTPLESSPNYVTITRSWNQKLAANLRETHSFCNDDNFALRLQR
jgi:hypothetical protein